MMSEKHLNIYSSGFTIIELLVVIVTIGILAAMTMVTYTGINDKAIVASLQSDLSVTVKQFKMYNVDFGSYPTALAETSSGSGVWCPSNPVVNTSYCLRLSSGNLYDSYTGTTTSFLLRIKNGSKIYMVTDGGQPGEVRPLTAIADITGTAQAGSVLSAGAITPSGATATYQWQSATTSNGTYTNIPGATSSTYTLVGSDIGKYIKVVATGNNTYFNSVTSNATTVVTAIAFTDIAATTGTLYTGDVLTAGALTPSGATVSYQWQSATTSNGTYSNIAGATNSTYTPVSGDIGNYIKVVATATGNYAGSATSAAVGPIAVNPWFTGIAGTALAGKYVYNRDVKNTDPPAMSVGPTWKTSATDCGAGVQCRTDVYPAPDPSYPSSLVLIDPIANSGVSFSAYPAQNTCKTLGGRLPTMYELLAMYAGRASYGNNFQSNGYWSATESSSINAYYVNFLNGTTGSTFKNVSWYVRCVKG